jgi:hypothetical protein
MACHLCTLLDIWGCHGLEYNLSCLILISVILSMNLLYMYQVCKGAILKWGIWY